MKKLIILISGFFLFAGCSSVETAPRQNVATNANKSNKTPPKSDNNVSLKPVKPDLKLNSKQQKYLDESLPPNVREILEKAEKFELLGETGEDTGEWMTFEPNRILNIADETDKKEILEAFYHDAAREDSPAVCYYPRHLIRATYQGKTAEIEICFSCSRFVVRSESGKFEGTLVRENRRSEDFFKQIIESKGTELKR